MAAFTILQYFLMLLVGGFLYFIFIYIGDVFRRVQDIFISTFPGFITEQTVAAGNFVIGIMIASPFLVMLALFIWAVVRQSTR